ncbi:MAG: MBL fold metallo-hydrolase [Actinomycetota bacterium]|nr:MBL fold metallo-hydrolase [Actinomycetota bacterium]
MTLEPIDLHHRGLDRVIGVYLVETAEGLGLFDCGPRTRFAALMEGLRQRGVGLTDIRHLLLSHIHLDHAGAAGTLVREHPGLRVHVSPVGARHLIDPTRLIASARRLYGDDLDTLYGEPEPVPEGNVRVVAERVVGLDCFPAPGHASHHVVYLDGAGTLYAGDASGVRILPGRHVLPHAPPPDVDLDGWERTFAEIERRAPERLALIHFGVAEDVAAHLERTRATLAAWAERVRAGVDEAEFVAAARAELAASEGGQGAAAYKHAAPLEQSFAGLARYWQKQREPRAV